MTTITASTTVGIDLNPASYTSPVTIKTGVTISNPGYAYAVYRHSGATAFFVIQNDGAITAGSGIGVYLAPGGAVTNATSASIFGGTAGIKIADGPATVVNDGSITATARYGTGVLLTSGGSVTNAASGVISVPVLGWGVQISDSGSDAGTLINQGQVIGAVQSALVINDASATIGSSVDAATVINSGMIGGAVGGTSVTNEVSAVITGQVQVDNGAIVNYGSIGGGLYGSNLFPGPGVSVTNAASGSITGGRYGVRAAAPWTITNDGKIAATDDPEGVGLYLDGILTNAASGSISALGTGIVLGFDRLVTGLDTVVNYGGISATFCGVSLLEAGTLINSGSITAYGGIAVSEAPNGGQIINAASGSITGQTTGVRLGSGATLTNAGSIVGNGGTAVYFGGTGGNLVLEPGFGFTGVVSGGTGGGTSLELASAASLGTVAGMGSEFIHFNSIAFDAGAQWFVSGLQRGLGGPINGFAHGDTIEFTGDTVTGSSFVSGVLTLDLAGGGTATLDLPGSFTSASDFAVTNVAAGADVTVVPCFAAGTRILTAAGQVPVEELTPGDRVATAAGRLAPITWLGHQRASVPPIRVRAGAFGDRMPARDLLLSPDHAVFADGALVPVRHLLNGCTVLHEPTAAVVYYHLELPAHAVILAESLPCESYLDTGNRAALAPTRNLYGHLRS